jgi:hypothetical protein
MGFFESIGRDGRQLAPIKKKNSDEKIATK